jgi:hypothetical protein
MLDRQHGEIIFTCDNCSEVLDTHQRTFDEARDVFSLEGWRSLKDGQIYVHYCPDCSKDFV